MSRALTRLVVGLFITTAVAACSEPGTGPTPNASEPAFAASPFPAGLATLEWHARARSLVSGANPMSPLLAGRIYAALAMAEYRAVLAVDRVLDSEGVQGPGLGAGGRSRLEAQRGAIAGASVPVLSFFFTSSAILEGLNALADAQGEAGPGDVHPQFTRGRAVGEDVGEAMVAYLGTDGFTRPFTGSVPSGPGIWIANGTPVGGTLGSVTPYFLDSGDQFRPPPPPAYLSPEFNTALSEALTVSQNRTATQEAEAREWNAPLGTPTPPGYWNAVAASYISEARLDERAAAHVLALTHGSVFDALIGCWDAKYFYWFLRPTQADAQVRLLFGLPNHPSYPSGHSCVSAAAGTILTHFFPNHAADVASAVAAAGFSRIVAGIHYRFDITAGNTLGRDVANWVLAQDQQ